MKYALISIGAVVIAIGLSILIALLNNKRYKIKGWRLTDDEI